MKSRSRSSRNTMSLCKGYQKQPYKPNETAPPMLVSASVDLTANMHDKPRNFILANKKNLRNFFKDRIPHQKIQIGQKISFMSPSKIFKLRQEQFSKQQTTKITLHKSFGVEQQIHKTPSTKKMNETFHARGLQKIASSPSQTSKNLKFMALSTYHTPTSSSLVKRSKTVKKQAYISVFGDKLIEQKSRMLEIQSATNLSLHEPKSVTTNEKPRPKTHLNQPKMEEQRQKLNMLLQKIQGFAKFINPHRIDFHKDKNFNPQFVHPQFKAKDETQKNQLIQWVKQASNDYKRRNENFENKRMRTVEDIERLDPMFYNKMKKHKNDRLWVRNKALGGLNSTKIQELSIKIQNSDNYYNFRQDQGWINQMITITDRNNINTIETQKKDRRFEYFFKAPSTAKQEKLIQFGQTLITTTNKAKLYGININKMYITLMKKRKPYQLEGSYAFFKFVKKGDLSMVANFAVKNQQYLHQVDNQLRTPLLYAVQNNRVDIVQYLLGQGVDVDAKNNKGQTSIAFAIAKEDYQLVKCLLQAGANPWSTQNYNLNTLVSLVKDQRIHVLLKNARKVRIALNLMRKPKLREQFWENNRKKIQGTELINFL